MNVGYAEIPESVDAQLRMPRIGLWTRWRVARQVRMTSARSRRRTAACVENVLERADRARTPFGSAVPVDRPAVRAARAELLELAERLRAPGAVDPDGVLLVRRLLVDGASPLYLPRHVDDLRDAVLHALDALDGPGGPR